MLIPFAGATYIASTRYADYKHAGFDVLFGSLEGILSAWFAFRFYHLPIRRGAGWAWGPRRRSAAFGIGTGVGTYGMSGGYGGSKNRGGDVEAGGLRHGQAGDVELHDVGHARTAHGSDMSTRPFAR